MDKAEFQSFLKVLPPVEFCCVYGSALHPNNVDKSTMVDYILGVSNPEQWHSQITEIADKIGVGVHFNPFVSWNNKEDLYAKICGLSYMGDLRMLFAEDRKKVKKIVQGQFGLFQSRYKPFLEEDELKELLRLTSSGTHQTHISQDCSLSLARSLVNSLPPNIRSQMGMKLGEKNRLSEFG